MIDAILDAPLVEASVGDSDEFQADLNALEEAQSTMKVHGSDIQMLIESRGIDMPEWDADNPASVATWTQVAEAYAAGASGTVRAVLGDNIRPEAVWWTELDRLIKNDNVTRVVRVHPDTLAESVIWPD
ncbi:hypothetical protein AB0O65_10230 [Microbacterium sp. NPDC077391]|uniref:hypothetical protein n=1 Tax=Microbacterium sp. NPDC077391 TaxID=3154765 RepID=UPI00342615A4